MKTIGSVLKRLLLALGGSAAENYLNDITLVDRIAELAENGRIPPSVIQELTLPLPISKGGHAATTAAQAAKNLGVLPFGEIVDKIPSGADLNNYGLPGVYAIATSSIASTIANIPAQNAGTLRVFASTGNAITASSAWKYLVQEYITLSGARYQRYGGSGSGTAVTWGAWETVHPTTLAALNGVSKTAVDLRNVDLNDYRTSGFYYIRTGVTNAPREWCWCIVCDGVGIMQMCIAPTDIFVRCYTGNPLAWTNWRSVALS